jgi:hypothetical protein
MTPAGIEPATFRFVARQLNYCATAVPLDLPPLSLQIFITVKPGSLRPTLFETVIQS